MPISVGKLIQPWCRTLPSQTASPRRSCRIPTRCRQALFETSGKCHCRSWTKRLSEAQLPTRNHRWAAAGLWSCQRLKSTDPNSPSRWEWCGPSSLEHRPTSSRQSRSGESAIRPLPFPYQVMSMVGSLWLKKVNRWYHKPICGACCKSCACWTRRGQTPMWNMMACHQHVGHVVVKFLLKHDNSWAYWTCHWQTPMWHTCKAWAG